MVYNTLLFTLCIVQLFNTYILIVKILCETNVFFANQHCAIFHHSRWKEYKKLKNDPNLYDIFYPSEKRDLNNPKRKTYFIQIFHVGYPCCNKESDTNKFLSSSVLLGLNGEDLLIQELINLKNK